MLTACIYPSCQGRAQLTPRKVQGNPHFYPVSIYAIPSQKGKEELPFPPTGIGGKGREKKRLKFPGRKGECRMKCGQRGAECPTVKLSPRLHSPAQPPAPGESTAAAARGRPL